MNQPQRDMNVFRDAATMMEAEMTVTTNQRRVARIGITVKLVTHSIW
jgi:hypothetical protein